MLCVVRDGHTLRYIHDEIFDDYPRVLTLKGHFVVYTLVQYDNGTMIRYVGSRDLLSFLVYTSGSAGVRPSMTFAASLFSLFLLLVLVFC